MLELPSEGGKTGMKMMISVQFCMNTLTKVVEENEGKDCGPCFGRGRWPQPGEEARLYWSYYAM